MPPRHRAHDRICRRADASAPTLREIVSTAPSAPWECKCRTAASRAGTVIATRSTNTFASLLPPEAPGVASALAELRTLSPSMAHLCLYAGVKQSAAELGLTQRICDSPRRPITMPTWRASRAIPRGFTHDVYFLSLAKDPDFERRIRAAHLGSDLPSALRLVRALGKRLRWKRRGQDYDDFKHGLADRLQWPEKHLPPVRRQTRHRGTLHAALHPPLYELPARRSLRSQRHPARPTALPYPATPLVRNLTSPGRNVPTLGITGAMIGEVLTASAVLGRNLLSVVSKPDRHSQVAA